MFFFALKTFVDEKFGQKSGCVLYMGAYYTRGNTVINCVDNVNWSPWKVSWTGISSISPLSERIEEGLTCKMSALETLNGGQFTLSTQLIV